MSELCTRFGGMTTAAWNAITPEVGSPPEGVIKLRVRPDPDSRDGYEVFSTLHHALQHLDRHQGHWKGIGVVRLLSFYWPVFTSSGATFDDSGGKVRAIGPVLSPEKCRYLLDCWRSIDAIDVEKVLDGYPIFFDLKERPHARFGSAKGLLTYLSCYAGFLEQAVVCDSFYFSYDGNCLG
jgi:hypothetical protein